MEIDNETIGDRCGQYFELNSNSADSINGKNESKSKQDLIIEESCVANQSHCIHYANLNLSLNLLKSSNLTLDDDRMTKKCFIKRRSLVSSKRKGFFAQVTNNYNLIAGLSLQLFLRSAKMLLNSANLGSLIRCMLKYHYSIFEQTY